MQLNSDNYTLKIPSYRPQPLQGDLATIKLVVSKMKYKDKEKSAMRVPRIRYD